MTKVTIVESKKEQYPIDWKTLTGGTVVGWSDGTIGIVFDGTLAKPQGIMLVDGSVQADGYLNDESLVVIGELKEIVVGGI